jgi:tachylectin
MKHRTRRPYLATAAFFLTALSSSTPLLAQTVRVNMPGTAFTAEGREVATDDVAGGRRFRGKAFATVVLRGVVQMPSSSAADPRMQRLVIHFRTSPSGPSLRSVELRNGSNVAFRLETNIGGDYTVRETTKPDGSANAWDFGQTGSKVGSQSVLRLEVQFPGGFDSQVNAGEFVLTAVGVDFSRKGLTGTSVLVQPPGGEPMARGGSMARGGPIARGVSPANVEVERPAGGSVVPLGVQGVIYALAPNNELLWYRHTGREDGSFSWAASAAKTVVGTGWGFKQVFPGEDGVIYAITSAGDLLWYRHDGQADGSFRWAAAEGKKVGSGWIFDRVFSGGGGVIYAITSSGDLLWYRHDGRSDGSARWAVPQGSKVGSGWAFKHVFSGGGGVIYAVTSADDLLWYRHDGHDNGSATWAAPQGKKVGSGWAVRQAFSGGDGVIYAVMANGDLLWNRHDGRGDGTFAWAAPQGKKIGSGWLFTDVFSR